MLKVNASKKELHPLVLGNSADVTVGDPVVAIGNPFGLDRTVTTGIVSALQRELKAPNNFTISNVIQTDAAINPGNSGGPLLDAQGKVIGINSQIATGRQLVAASASASRSRSTPSRRSRPSCAKEGKVEHAFLGVTGVSIATRSPKSLNLPTDSGRAGAELDRPGEERPASRPATPRSRSAATSSCWAAT